MQLAMLMSETDRPFLLSGLSYEQVGPRFYELVLVRKAYWQLPEDPIGILRVSGFERREPVSTAKQRHLCNTVCAVARAVA